MWSGTRHLPRKPHGPTARSSARGPHREPSRGEPPSSTRTCSRAASRRRCGPSIHLRGGRGGPRGGASPGDDGARHAAGEGEARAAHRAGGQLRRFRASAPACAPEADDERDDDGAIPADDLLPGLAEGRGWRSTPRRSTSFRCAPKRSTRFPPPSPRPLLRRGSFTGDAAMGTSPKPRSSGCSGSARWAPATPLLSKV